MASFCMAVSSFVIMLIFMASNAAQEFLVSYFYSDSPQLFSVTCKIEGDQKYQLTENEIESIVTKYSDIENAYYYVSPLKPCTVCGKDTSLSVFGVSCMPDNSYICAGKDLFSGDEVYSHGIMLSEKNAEGLYGFPSSAVGESIMINSADGIVREYRIIGVYRSESEADCNKALVTFSTYRDLFEINECVRFGYIQFRLSDINSSEDMALIIKKVLSNRCMENSDYKVRIMNLDLTDNIKAVIRIVTFVLLVASIIIILVSGIGIRNVIISIMQSYTHIIGIEKAIGASEEVIAVEYLLQGGVIAVTGTFLGCISALVLMAAANVNIVVILEHLSELFDLEYLSTISFKFSITMSEILITSVISVIMVMVCCYDPVRRIASMRVVDSLRK